jgi:hypothetical protein
MHGGVVDGSRSFLASFDGGIQLLALFRVAAATATIEARHTSALPGKGRTGEGQLHERLMNTGNGILGTMVVGSEYETAAQSCVFGQLK